MSAGSKTIAKRLGWLASAIFACWMIAQTYYWQTGWRHYEAGGGVFVHDELNEKEMEAALASFRTAAKINPWNSKYRSYSAKALMELGRYNEALEEFDSALAISARSFTAHYGKAYALLKLERYPEMATSLRTAISLQHRLNSVVRFSEEFADVRDKPFMQEFRDQY